MVFNMPYNILPMRNVFIKFWRGIDAEEIDMASSYTILVSALACNVLCYLFSIITSEVGDVMTVVGDTLNVFMCFMVPCLFYIAAKVKIQCLKSSDGKLLQPWVICIVCGMLGVVSLNMFALEKMQVKWISF